MIGLVMAGGKGTRMKIDKEKLLLKYKKPVILNVVDSLIKSNSFSKVLAVTSSNSPKTKKFLEQNNVEIIDTPGISYVKDLNLTLKNIDDVVLVISGDLPLVDEEIIKKIVSQYDSKSVWTSILVTNRFLTSLGLESNYSIFFENQECHYTGISLINATKIMSLEEIDENYIIMDDKRIAFNLNTKHDYDLLSTT